jgi:uncharacterized membrane protein
VSEVAVGLALALAASLALNFAFLLQHAGSVGEAAITPLRPLATLRTLLRSPLWLVGGALGMAGWGLHVAALAHAPLSLVQAFVAGGLVLAVPLAVGALGHRLDRREVRGVLLLAGSLVLLSIGLGNPPAHATYDSALLAGYVGGAAALAALLALAPPGEHRPSALGLAGGVFYGAADMAIKALTSVEHAGGMDAILRSPWLPVVGVLTTGAFFAFQRGLQAGRAVTVIALMTAGTNIVSILGGLVVFGDPLGRTPLLQALHVAGFAMVLWAAWRLAPLQAALAGEEEKA